MGVACSARPVFDSGDERRLLRIVPPRQPRIMQPHPRQLRIMQLFAFVPRYRSLATVQLLSAPAVPGWGSACESIGLAESGSTCCAPACWATVGSAGLPRRLPCLRFFFEMHCLHLLLTVAVERLAVSAETRALPPGALSASSSRAVQKKLQRWALLHSAA